MAQFLDTVPFVQADSRGCFSYLLRLQIYKRIVAKTAEHINEN